MYMFVPATLCLSQCLAKRSLDFFTNSLFLLGREKWQESVSTCRFAQRVAQVKNTAEANEEVDPILVIRRLKQEIAGLKEEITFLKGEMVRN